MWRRYAAPVGNGEERRERVGDGREVLRLSVDYHGVTPQQRDQAFLKVFGSPDVLRIEASDTGDGGLDTAAR